MFFSSPTYGNCISAKLETSPLFFKQTTNAVERIAASFQSLDRLVVGVKERNVKKKQNNAINVTRTWPIRKFGFCSKPNSPDIGPQELQMYLLIVWGAYLGNEQCIQFLRKKRIFFVPRLQTCCPWVSEDGANVNQKIAFVAERNK